MTVSTVLRKERSMTPGAIRTRRYVNTSKGKAARKKYMESEAGKAASKRWHASEKGKSYSHKYIEEYRKNYPERVWATYTLTNHRRKGYDIRLTYEDVLDIYNKNDGRCYLCGEKLEFVVGKGLRRNSPTLDRINNENHLDKSNVNILCFKCNVMKQDMTLDEFVTYCANICKRMVN